MATRISFETPPSTTGQPTPGRSVPPSPAQPAARSGNLWEIRPFGVAAPTETPTSSPVTTEVDPKKKRAKLVLVGVLTLVLAGLLVVSSNRSTKTPESSSQVINDYRLYLDQRTPQLPAQLKQSRYQAAEQHLREFERAQQAKAFKRARTELDELFILDRDTLSPLYRFSVNQLKKLPRD